MDDGGQAFPNIIANDVGTQSSTNVQGMSLRDFMAAAALQGLLTCPEYMRPVDNNDPDWEKTVGGLAAKYAYGYADSMLQARKS